jgi:hypothetical protein
MLSSPKRNYCRLQTSENIMALFKVNQLLFVLVVCFSIVSTFKLKSRELENDPETLETKPGFAVVIFYKLKTICNDFLANFTILTKPFA